MKKIIHLSIIAIVLLSCTNTKVENNLKNELSLVKKERDSLETKINTIKDSKRNQIASFLTFQEGEAEQAMSFYTDLFNNSKIINVTYQHQLVYHLLDVNCFQ